VEVLSANIVATSPSPNGEANDLQPIAFSAYPDLKALYLHLQKTAAAERVYMTGSGPTIVCEYNTETVATEAAARIRKDCAGYAVFPIIYLPT
jgi:4-diphosphocytidyl-2C-methyl-D-erythritol kinase